MRKELQKRDSGEPVKEQTPVFKEMYRSLQRAKQILIALMEILGLNDENEGIIGNILGKRQRTQ